MKDYIKQLETEFTENANVETAKGQMAYMKNQFAFCGIKTPLRRKIQKPFLDKDFLPPKKDLDTELLTFVIHSFLGSNEFFINKSIGWILRNYSRINPAWVIDFTNNTRLDKLSRKEALRLIRDTAS